MKKLLSLFFLAGTLVFAISCGDDDGGNPQPEKTREQLIEEAIAASQAAVDSEASVDESATGVTDASVFEGWTLASVKGQLGGDDNTPDAPSAAAPVVNVAANIDEDTEWTKDNVYQLDTRVTVLAGVTLTIEAGTIIKGNAALTGANAAVLMIARGGTIIAEGTADEPIIMTSTDDDIQPGDLSGTTLTNDQGKWGGLVILGKAPVSAKTEDPQIEGVDAADTNGRYGGTDAADNSGVVKYVSIRHGGAQIAEGSEINGLTLGGVGTGTTIEYVEVYGNSDDGIEFFGGTVNVNHALIYAVGDDALDVDQSYAGTVDNFVVYTDSQSDEILEIDGREGTLDDSFKLMNGTAYGIDGAATTADFKSKAKGTISNVVFENGEVKLSASFDTETYEESEDAASNTADGSLVFSEVSTTGFEVYTSSFEGE